METVALNPLSQFLKLGGGRQCLERSYFEIGTQIYCLHCLREAFSFLEIYCPWCCLPCELPGSCFGRRCEADPEGSQIFPTPVVGICCLAAWFGILHRVFLTICALHMFLVVWGAATREG